MEGAVTFIVAFFHLFSGSTNFLYSSFQFQKYIGIMVSLILVHEEISFFPDAICLCQI
jgi:hypothetical protein